MATQLADLDRAIRWERDRRTKRKPKSILPQATQPAPGKAAQPVAQNLAWVRPRTVLHTRSRTLALPVEYAVPGPFAVLAQPTPNSCWATVFTMMYSWKKAQSMTIETALAEVGQRWLNIFQADTGLSGGDKADFVATAGLLAEPPSSLSLERWEQLLRTNGPIWVTTDEAPGKAWAIHARIIIGLHGDGTPEGTSFTIVDPAGGRQYDETIATFIPKYEEEVRRTGYTRIQILYWPADARYAAQKALSSRSSRAMNVYGSYGRAFDGGTTVALAGLGWEVFQAVANNEGDIHWSTQRMEGAKHPWDQKEKYENVGRWNTKSIRVKQKMEIGFIKTIELSATFNLTFRYNGRSVGYISIENVGTSDAPMNGIDVQVTIMPDPNTYRVGTVEPVAGVGVTFNYHFTNSIRDDAIYVLNLALYGTGDFEQQGQWTQT